MKKQWSSSRLLNHSVSNIYLDRYQISIWKAEWHNVKQNKLMLVNHSNELSIKKFNLNRKSHNNLLKIHKYLCIQIFDGKNQTSICVV